VIEGPLHGQETSISGFRAGTQRKSEGQSFVSRAMTRRKSASELELKPDDTDRRRRTQKTLDQRLVQSRVGMKGICVTKGEV